MRGECGAAPAASSDRLFRSARIARAAGETARVTVGVELTSTGVAHAGQNAAPSGNSRAQEEHFIRKFGSRLESRHRTLRLTPIQRIWGGAVDPGEITNEWRRLVPGLSRNRTSAVLELHM